MIEDFGLSCVDQEHWELNFGYFVSLHDQTQPTMHDTLFLSYGQMEHNNDEAQVLTSLTLMN
jgi:hypothetical protein